MQTIKLIVILYKRELYFWEATISRILVKIVLVNISGFTVPTVSSKILAWLLFRKFFNFPNY